MAKHKLSLCALPSTCSMNFRVAKGRRDFDSLQRVEDNTRYKPHLALQRSLVRDKLQEIVARITWLVRSKNGKLKKV